jgi:hypothetical protein
MLAWLLFFSLVVWVAVILVAPQERKPIVACSPIAWLGQGVRNAAAAVNPGSAFQDYGERFRDATSSWCVRYAANLLLELPKRDEAARTAAQTSPVKP